VSAARARSIGTSASARAISPSAAEASTLMAGILAHEDVADETGTRAERSKGRTLPANGNHVRYFDTGDLGGVGPGCTG
jgi:hypothetical protein